MGTSKELPYRRHNGTDIYQGCRSDRRGIGLSCHPLSNHSLHAKKAHPELVLKELPYGSYPSISQVVDIIWLLLAVVHQNHLPDYGYQVFPGKVLLIGTDVYTQPAIQLVPSHPAQVVAAWVKKQVLHQVSSVLHVWGFAGPEAAVELQEGLILTLDIGVPLQSSFYVLVLRVGINVLEKCQQLIVIHYAQGTKEGGNRCLSLAVHLYRQDVFVAGLELQPCAPIGNQLAPTQIPIAGRISFHG